MTASLGIAPASADDPRYPSWDDVQNAKNNEATKQAEIDSIASLIAGLQTAVDDASITAMKKAEAWRQAKEALDTAAQQLADLEAQAGAASAKAQTSKMRAGLLAAHLSRAAGSDLSMNLVAQGQDAGDLLYQLGAMSQLSEQSQRVYSEALADKQNAESLGHQADIAVVEHQKLSDAADAARADADAAAASAQSALSAQETKSTELIAQLALLKDSTVEVETAYLEGEQKRQAAEAAAAAAAEAERQHVAAAAAAAAQAEAASRPAQSSSQPAPAAPPQAVQPPSESAPSQPAPSQPSPSQPVTSQPDPDPQPQGNAVETAISYAMAQLGEEYVLGGMGPDQWDCSGLTKASYASAGIYIGTHSATNQYNQMAAEGKLVPYSQRQRGDLIFWGGGGDYYHVAIYLGNGQIVEAADYGKPVRVWNVWGSPTGMVGRPSA
ncbi:C40 family peptidase [Rathayibacter sp. VKM Ac-2878]|nr:C40 family peptidase [Rathayibacter sp. VKM Ac-2879]MBF4504629.1 C40 family peptidase [Rathayibacter sp. VKM Ac-2878]